MNNPVSAYTAALLFAVTLATPALAEDSLAAKHRFVHESVQVSDHHVFNSTVMVDGATVLVRNNRRQEVEATISSRALEPDTAYSIWWAVFNQPRYCIEPNRCALADLGANADPRVRPSVFWGGGFISDAYGVANTALRLARGRTTRERFANTADYGLENVAGAEIHVVLRSHGTVGAAGSVAKQVGTALEACPTNGCQNVFASIHIVE